MRNDSPRKITITPELPGHGGVSIGRLDGKVVMVRGAIPGETVEAVVSEEKKDYCKATATRILEPSPDRVKPPCGYFGRCGGCHLQYIGYGRQVRMKEEVLASSLRRMAGLEVELSPPLAGPDFRYRRRARFKLSRAGMGFYRERSRDVVDIATCPLMVEQLDIGYKSAREILNGVGADELHICCGEGTAAVVKASLSVKVNWDSVANSLIEAGFSGVLIELGGGRVRSYGSPSVALDLDGLKYGVSAAGFFQANWGLNLAAVRMVMNTLGPLEGMRVVDLYAGAGNFALPLAARGADVVAVEENPVGVRDGERNTALNGITSCRFVRSDVDGFDVTGPVDVLVADPPRAGISGPAMSRILSLGPERIVYLSCDPATFSRDIKRLGERYAVESVRLADFFPQTYHIESLALLRLR